MKTVVFDFDGVIHSYKSGWKGIDVIPDPPVDGIGDTIAELRTDGYEVVVVSTRCAEECGILAVKQYLNKNGIVVDRVMKEKPPAIVYIDDRAICFDGNAKALVEKVKGFKNWLEEEKEMKTEVVRINLHGNEMPVSHGEWVDLYTAEDVTLGPLDFKIISLGYAMELPEGYYAQVVPRSSTCKNWGIIMANSVGIIENTYCGDNDVWGFPAVAIRDTTIPKGTRICQFRLCKKEVMPEFVPVESLGNPDRGGWGSTGNK